MIELKLLPDGGPPCNEHPDAPHGFNRNASHDANRYVCDCEGWEPVDVQPVADKCFMCHGTGKHAMPVAIPAGVPMPPKIMVECQQCKPTLSNSTELGSQPVAEPVAWECREHGDDQWHSISRDLFNYNPRRYVYRALYTHPQDAQPVAKLITAPVAWMILDSVLLRPCVVTLDADELQAHNPDHIVPLFSRKQGDQAKLSEAGIQISDENEAEYQTIYRLSSLLAEIAINLKGPEKALKRHGYADLPRLVLKLVFEVEMLKQNAQAIRRKALEEALEAVKKRYMGDNNREDMEVCMCAHAIKDLINPKEKP